MADVPETTPGWGRSAEQVTLNSTCAATEKETRLSYHVLRLYFQIRLGRCPRLTSVLCEQSWKGRFRTRIRPIGKTGERAGRQSRRGRNSDASRDCVRFHIKLERMRPVFLFFPLSEFWRTLLASIIGLLTLAGIMTRPFRWSEARIAMIGAGTLLLLGLIRPGDAARTLLRDWNTFLFFLGMMGLSALAETAGLFDWLAAQAAQFAKQSAARLFLNVFLLGTLITMIFSNDATALILTPVVYVLVTRLRLPVLPYLFACTFIADSASFLLPISNPINVIIMSRFPLDLLTFLRLLFLPSLVVIAINLGIFYLLYRKQLRGSFEISHLPTAEKAVKHKAYFRYTLWVLAFVAPSYVIASAFQFPLSVVAVAGASLLLAGALFWKRTTLLEACKGISWPIFGFIAGMFVVVRAIEDTGLTLKLGKLL